MNSFLLHVGEPVLQGPAGSLITRGSDLNLKGISKLNCLCDQFFKTETVVFCHWPVPFEFKRRMSPRKNNIVIAFTKGGA